MTHRLLLAGFLLSLVVSLASASEYETTTEKNAKDSNEPFEESKYYGYYPRHRPRRFGPFGGGHGPLIPPRETLETKGEVKPNYYGGGGGYGYGGGGYGYGGGGYGYGGGGYRGGGYGGGGYGGGGYYGHHRHRYGWGGGGGGYYPPQDKEAETKN